MARPKSFLPRLQVDRALKSHDCQHHSAHRIAMGDIRLKATEGRSPDHYCRECGLQTLSRDIQILLALREQLEQP
jgi:hypothetical protein